MIFAYSDGGDDIRRSNQVPATPDGYGRCLLHPTAASRGNPPDHQPDSGHPHAQQLLLQRCGISSKWLDGKRARFLSRRTRRYGHTPAFTRYAVELLGYDPDAYYMVGVEHRIPEPTPEAMAKCINALLGAGFSLEAVETAMSVLGVPRGGHHPPKRKH